MEKLYRQHILKGPVPEGGFVPLGSITIASAGVNSSSKTEPKADEKKEEVMGD